MKIEVEPVILDWECQDCKQVFTKYSEAALHMGEVHGRMPRLEAVDEALQGLILGVLQ